MGEPELVEVRCHRWRVMKEKYGFWSYIKEKHRDEIISYVFVGRPEAVQLFADIEQKYLTVADGGDMGSNLYGLLLKQHVL